MNESIIKAAQTAQLLLSDLREAHKTATPIESLILLPMIQHAAQLEMQLRGVMYALGCKE